MRRDADAEAFERLRPHLLRVAHGLLASATDAEDVVQEAWLRFQRAERGEIRDLRAWLTTVVGRLALDVLTSAYRRHEQLAGSLQAESRSVPQPAVDPAERVALDERVGVALLVVLRTLSPAERTVFALHDVFGFSFPEIARATDRSEQACRQLAVRARRHVGAGMPRFAAGSRRQRRLAEAFAAAGEGGSLQALLRTLDPGGGWRGQAGSFVPLASAPRAPVRRALRALLRTLSRGSARARRPCGPAGAARRSATRRS